MLTHNDNKRLHETLAKQRLPLARPSLFITVTTGSYVYNMKGDEKLTSKQLLSLVDLDMYQKKGGRHR